MPSPGCYTLHTLRDDRIAGTLLVDASDGALWYHGWYGDSLELSESE